MIPEAIMLADFLPLLLIPPLSNFISIGRSHNPIPYTTSIFVVFFYPINIITSRNQCFARWNRVGAILIVIIIIFPIKAIVVCRYYFNQFSASRLNICLSVSMFMALFSLSCFAQENSFGKKIYTEDLGDGVTVVVTLSETNGIARSSRTHSVTKEYYKDGAYIGAATLYASFYYDGSSSSATAASGAGAGSNGWSYSGQSVWTSGNSAYLNATLSRNGTFIPVSLSLCCDAYGNVSWFSIEW